MRSLKDLYVRGAEVSLDDGSGDPVAVWVQKLNPVEHRTAIEKAQAKKARILALKHQPDSEEYQTIVSEAENTEHSELIDLLGFAERSRMAAPTWAEIADKAEWKEDGYLDGLVRSWQDELADKHKEDPDDPEASRVRAELARFDDQVTEELDNRTDSFKQGLETMPEQDIWDLAIEHLLRTSADLLWTSEYMAWALYFGTRDPKEKGKRLFDTRAEVDELQLPVYTQIRDAITSITAEPLEGKDSAATPPSSPSSEPCEKVEE